MKWKTENGIRNTQYRIWHRITLQYSAWSHVLQSVNHWSLVNPADLILPKGNFQIWNEMIILYLTKSSCWPPHPATTYHKTGLLKISRLNFATSINPNVQWFTNWKWQKQEVGAAGGLIVFCFAPSIFAQADPYF